MTKAHALEIYEKHIRRLPRAERLRLLALLANDLIDDETEEVPGEVPTDDIMAYHGLGKELWEGIDAQEYVNALREGREFPGERRPDAE
jgi:hypothetical protein